MGKILGIIAEYNPFHNGHLYHITKSKELVSPDYTVCIISGHFVQRGNVSIVDKWSKAEMALNAGANLVIELPTIYSISSAENFSEGCIKLLSSFKQDTILSFGSECGDIKAIKKFADILCEEPPEYKSLLNHELQTGISYPKARENALLMYVNDIRKYANILSCPNNILGIEYIKAIKRLKSSVIPTTIKRYGVEHDSTNVSDSYTSASYIRDLLCENANISKFVPNFTYDILARQINSGKTVLDVVAFEKEILFTLRKMSIEQINQLPDVNENLANTILSAINSCNSYNELVDKIKSKTYTLTRIQRILLYALLDVTKQDMENSRKVKPYIRVLGLDSKGKQLLSKLSKSNSRQPVITSVKDFYKKSNNKILNKMLDLDILATNIYTLGYLDGSEANLDYTKKIVTLSSKKEILNQ